MLKKTNFTLALALCSCAALSKVGSVKYLHGASVIFDAQHGALIENEKCPWLSIPISIGVSLGTSAKGRAFLEALHGNGKLGMAPKYLVVYGRAVRNNMQTGELRITSVSNFYERLYDPSARAERLNKTQGCVARRRSRPHDE